MSGDRLELDREAKKTGKIEFKVDKNGNLKYIIEYNGEQHYIFNKFMHLTQEGFETHKLRDKLKEDYCKKNNIPLYIIRYDEDLKISLDKIIKPDN